MAQISRVILCVVLQVTMQLLIANAAEIQVNNDAAFSEKRMLQQGWTPVLSNYRQVVPADNLPQEAKEYVDLSNNCVGITTFNNTLFMGWRYLFRSVFELLISFFAFFALLYCRSGPFHFAAPSVVMIIISSPDMGKTWQFEVRCIYSGFSESC